MKTNEVVIVELQLSTDQIETNLNKIDISPAILIPAHSPADCVPGSMDSPTA